MASISGHNTICLRADNGRHEEFIITGTPKPGTNVVRDATARVMEVDTAVPGASTPGGTGAVSASTPLAIVKEQAHIGKTIDDAVTTGEQTGVYIPGSGDVLLVLALAGEDIDKEEGVSFNAAGKAIAATVNACCKSLDDTGGALAADTHIRVIIT